MVFTASQIAGILEGEVEGNPEIAVHKLAKIEEGEKRLFALAAVKMDVSTERLNELIDSTLNSSN